MAVVKAINGGKDLRRAIRYILRRDKTRDDLIGGHNLLDPHHNAYAEMMATKEQWGKTGGRMYQHYTISFHPDLDIAPEEVHTITMELIEQCPLFAGYEAVYATHIDCSHLHSHIILNSVSFETGRKYQCSPDQLEEMKRLCSQIVQEHGYPLEHEMAESRYAAPDSTATYQVLSQTYEGRRSSWMYDLWQTVQEAEAAAPDLDSFIREMEARGCGVRWGRRSITYTTPDDNRMRADRLERIFKMPSIRAKYADPETEQEQLREDLRRVKRKPKQAQPEQEPEVDYAAYRMDLEDPDSPARSGSAEGTDSLYETACAVCRQMRCARTADDFYQGMRAGGYPVRYDKAGRQHWIRTPYGDEIPAETLERIYGLPSIRQAVIHLHRRPHVRKPQWDGRLWPEYLERQGEKDWNHILDTDDQNGYRRTAAGNAAYRKDRKRRPMTDRCARVHTYISADSPMWDHELQAAALVLGQGVCDPDSLDELLREHGYRLVTGEAVTYIETPRGRRIVIDDNPPQPIEDSGPFRRGIIAAVAGEYLRYIGRPRRYRRYRSRSDRGGEALGELTVLAVLGIASLIELIARLVCHGIHVCRRRHREKTIYEVATEKASMTLDEALGRAGVAAEFAKTVPQIVPESEEPREQDVQPDPETEDKKDWPDVMDDLLSAVKKASVAADQESFDEILKEQGYGTRWTEKGTLTFITPDGEHIRAWRLEKRFGLAPIAAAYGYDREPPARGTRFEAAEAVRKAAASADNREAFDLAMQEQGYAVRWKADQSDATITAPGGQRMRLSSLDRTFDVFGSDREEIPFANSTGSSPPGRESGNRIIRAEGEERSDGTRHDDAEASQRGGGAQQQTGRSGRRSGRRDRGAGRVGRASRERQQIASQTVSEQQRYAQESERSRRTREDTDFER